MPYDDTMHEFEVQGGPSALFQDLADGRSQRQVTIRCVTFSFPVCRLQSVRSKTRRTSQVGAAMALRVGRSRLFSSFVELQSRAGQENVQSTVRS